MTPALYFACLCIFICLTNVVFNNYILCRQVTVDIPEVYMQVENVLTTYSEPFVIWGSIWVEIWLQCLSSLRKTADIQTIKETIE